MNDGLYFAYGSNMDPRQMTVRCPEAILEGVAILKSWSFVINRRGVATISKKESDEVWGVLWRLAMEDEAALDIYESVQREIM